MIFIPHRAVLQNTLSQKGYEKMEVYFDNSATTKPCKAAVDAVTDTLTVNYGNPSSLHRLGLNAENIIKDARETAAKKLKVDPSCVYFTSGGTESNNLAIAGVCGAMRKKGTVITSKIEHKSVLECFSYLEKQGFCVKYLDCDKNGVVNLDRLREYADENTCFVSVMHVNNETGAIQPIDEISAIVKRANPAAIVHTDDVQGFCKVPLNSKSVDIISVSAHKVHGIKGCGAVYIKKGIKADPVILGGGQEKGLRNGTEAVPAIAAFSAAIKSYKPTLTSEIKDYIAQNVTKNIDGCRINSVGGSAYILNLSVPGFKSETLLHLMEQQGIYVSSGSACSSNRPQLSHVLTAMGLEKSVVESSLRLSFCNENTMDEAKYFCEKLADAAEANKSVRRNYK